MRVAFFGTPAFAATTLVALLDAGHEVIAVVAQPDKPSGRGQALVSPPTVHLARSHGIPVFQPTKLRSGDFPSAFAALNADVAVVVAYGRILPLPVLNAPRLGCINVHASLLPRWRGAAPIQWSVLVGDESTGITTMQMAQGLDTGDILLQECTPIGPEETSGELFERLAPLGAALLIRTLAQLGEIAPVVQNEAEVTYAPMLTREMSPLDFSRPAAALHSQVRGLSPWPGTTFVVAGQPVKALRVRAVPESGEPGTLLPGARVACGEGALELLDVQAAGKRAVSGADYFNGARLGVGARLG